MIYFYLKKITSPGLVSRWATHVSGTYQLALNCHAVAAEGSPVEVTVEMPVTTASHCTVRGIKDVVAGVRSFFVVLAKDQAGNQRTRGGDDFLSVIRGPAA